MPMFNDNFFKGYYSYNGLKFHIWDSDTIASNDGIAHTERFKINEVFTRLQI